MISDNLIRDTEPGDNLIEYEEGNNLPIGFYSRHGFIPLSKLVDYHNNMLMPLAEVGLQSMKSTPHLVKGPTVMTG
jgi:hypothetical protein